MLLAIISIGCSKDNNVTFHATIEKVDENSIFVTTTDDVGFDKASVSFSKDLEVKFNLLVGQKVTITILPEIRTSYPVQVTAVKIEPYKEN
jgi:hypothetical protein